MGLHDALEKNRWVTVSLALVVLGTACVLIYRSLWPYSGSNYRPAPTQAYFYDLGSGQIFVGTGRRGGRIVAPSGKVDDKGQAGGVAARVFACGDCAKPSDRFTGYLENNQRTGRSNPRQAALALQQEPPSPERDKRIADAKEDARQAAHFLARPEADPTWFAESTEEGRAILAEPAAHCGGSTPIECKP